MHSVFWLHHLGRDIDYRISNIDQEKVYNNTS